MKKRAVLTLLCMGLLLGANAKAVTVDIQENSRSVTVTENADTATDGVIIVAKADADINDNANVFAMESATADDGKLVFEFDMQDERDGNVTDGEYDIYIRRLGKDTVKGSFIYATVESRKRVVSGISGAESENAIAEILDSEENLVALKAMGCDMESYEKSANKSQTVAMFYKQTKDISDLGENNIKEYLNLAIAAGNINSSDKDTDKNLLLANFSFEDVSYSEITDEKLKKWIAKSLSEGKPYNSVSEIEEGYKKSVMIYNIINSRLTAFEDTLDDYAEGLGIKNDSDYKKYRNKTKKDKLNENILTELKSKDFVDTEILLDVIVTETEEISKNTNSGNTSGGGGGGGGSSSGGSSVGGITTSIPANEEALGEENELPPVIPVFDDMSGSEWAVEAVNKMAEAEIISGDGNGRFNPTGTLTREAFIKMLVMASGVYDENAECDFEDVSKDAWYYRYVASAVNAGLASGVSDKEFGIGRNIKRQDMTVLCYRVAKQGTMPEKIREAADFADKDNISEYAKEAVAELYMSGIVNGMGDNSFNPEGTATRAQGAMIIYNLFFK